MKIVYLGPVGTFSNEACDNCFDETYEKIPYKTIKETIIALKNSKVDKCIIPVENSLQGCVTEAIDTLIQNENIYVEKEYILKINQNLMAKEKYNIEVLTVQADLADEKEIIGTEYIGTESTITIYKDENDIEGTTYTFEVIGDVTGDGRMNITDVLKLRAHIVKAIELQGYYKVMADVNEDNEINSTDVMLLRKLITERQ